MPWTGMSYFLLHTIIFGQMNLSNKAFKGISEIKIFARSLKQTNITSSLQINSGILFAKAYYWKLRHQLLCGFVEGQVLGNYVPLNV